MAASPIAALPVIRTLVTVNLYSHFGTYHSTDGAAGAFAAGIEGSRRVAAGIDFIGLRDGVLGAEVDAEFASLTKLLVYFDIALRAHLKAFLFTIHLILSPKRNRVKCSRHAWQVMMKQGQVSDMPLHSYRKVRYIFEMSEEGKLPLPPRASAAASRSP